jgi:type II secretory pathway predicted ATPase ExeA
MSHNSYYGLSCNPFDKQSLRVKDFFPSEDYREMLSRLDYLKDVRGIGVFTAPPGLGKSFVLRCFQQSLNPNLYQMHYLCLSTISVSEFYKQLCEELGLSVRGGKTVMFQAIQERIFYLFKEKRCPLIVVIDEAQYLGSNILKDLKMLMNYQYDSLNCFSLILAGEPFLNHTLEKAVNEALKQRITVHYNFVGLDPDEVTSYVHHKITLAGGAKDILGEDALSALTGFCHGNPRMIDNLMTDVLLLGAQLEKQVIDADVIMAAANAQALS